MTEKTNVQESRFDLLKWIGAAVLVAVAVYGNSYFSDESVLYRTIGVLILGGAAAWIAAQTTKGAAFITLVLEAKTEIRKVVWPSRQETTQTTIIVLIVVFIVALVLWLLDWGLGRIVSGIIG